MEYSEAVEILHDHAECELRKNSCKWHCDICAYGQHTRQELKEAKEVMKNEGTGKGYQG